MSNKDTQEENTASYDPDSVSVINDPLIKLENEVDENSMDDMFVWGNSVFINEIGHPRPIKEENEEETKSSDDVEIFSDEVGNKLEIKLEEGVNILIKEEIEDQLEIKDTDIKPTPYFCDLCDYRCKERRSLWRHKKISHDSVRYFCKLCDYKSTRKEHLNTHVSTIHLGISYLCDQCGYKATQECHLKRHKDAKHGLEQFYCNQCAYKTTLKSSLKNHVKSIHEGQRFKCDICDFLSASRSNLSKHTRAVHKQIRFKCEICDYESTTRGNIRTHTKAVHENFKFYCDLCDYRSGYKAHLKKHQDIHHGIKSFPPTGAEKCDNFVKHINEEPGQNKESDMSIWHNNVFENGVEDSDSMKEFKILPTSSHSTDKPTVGGENILLQNYDGNLAPPVIHPNQK